MANNTRRHTALQGCPDPIGTMERLDLWTSTTRRQQDALRRATTAAELAAVLWARMTEEQRRQLAEDAQIEYLVRQLTSAGYGVA